MANPWCRLYSEFEDDPKVQMLPEKMQRRLVMLFCQWCKGERRTDAQLAFKWRVLPTDVAETKALFLESGFIDEKWRLVNWYKRQFIGDSSADRQKRYRQRIKQRKAAPNKASDGALRDGDVLDTDTDTEQIQKKTIARNGHVARFSSSDIESIYLQYPRKTARAAALKAIKKALENLDEENPVAALRVRVTEFANSPAGHKGEFVPYPATWFNRKQYLDDPKEWEK